LSDLAENSGVSKAYISDLENGTAGKTTIRCAYVIAVALDETLDNFVSQAAAKPVRSPGRRSSYFKDCGSTAMGSPVSAGSGDVSH